MKLNIDFYEAKEETIQEEEKNIIEQYIEKIEGNEYEKEFPEQVTEKEIYYLSSSSQNILNWYPFKKEDKILEIGGDLGQLTKIYTDNCQEVTTIEPNIIKAKAISKRYQNTNNLEIIVGNMQKIKLEKKYDYIIFIGRTDRIKEIMGQDMKLTDAIKKLEQYLSEEGKFLIAVDNKFGLRYFAGDPENILNKKFISLNGYNNENEKIETYTKKRLKRKINEIGYKANFYYPLPDYKLPNVIFTDNQLPQYNNIDKYMPYHTEKSDLLINEIDVFREILKDNEEMFTFFANSFLVEISKKENPIKYKYISFNNCRKAKYRLITKIAEDHVEKQPTNKQAINHYENIKKNIKRLTEQNIKTLDYEVEGKIQSKYINQEILLGNVITKALEENNQELLETVMAKYIETLNHNTYKEEDYQKTVFYKYNIEIEDKEIIKQLHFQKNGLWDMTFNNCFYIDGELYLFDQEWNEPNLPTEYILYRSILYTISLRRFVNIEEWFQKYDITKYRTIFEKLDEKLQEEIRDDKIWQFYSQNHNFKIDETKQEVINLNLRNSAQEAFIKNLQSETEQLKNEIEQLKQENKKIQNELTKTFSHRFRRKLKKIMGDKHE